MDLREEQISGSNPAVLLELTIASMAFDGTGHLVLTWAGVDSDLVSANPDSTMNVMGAATVDGAYTEIPGASVFGSEWTWTSTDPVAGAVQFVKLVAAELE